MPFDRISCEKKLASFDPSLRQEGIQSIAEAITEKDIEPPALTGQVNVHLHTFFSFNAMDYSPGRIVWEAFRQGLDVVGSVDFDVLDAMDEILKAGDLLGIRAVAAIETRVFMPTLADKEINSPGEPGISYFMGTGFTSIPPRVSYAETCLSGMREQAAERNIAMSRRVNSYLAPVEIDYEKDVLVLTPSGNATERHMLAAYDSRAREVFPEKEELVSFWAERLHIEEEAIAELIDDTAGFRNMVRKKLMKKGGVGYTQPDASTFPQIGEVIKMITDCGAIPCATWLDGTTDGEQNPGELLDHYLSLGCLALNIVPDRNWNISDPEVKAVKTDNLNRLVQAGRERNMIFSVGTEMNNYGLKFVDTFDAPEMQPHAEIFKQGAYILYAHTLLQRGSKKGRTSLWAENQFGDDRGAANAFYLQVGEKAFPPAEALRKVRTLAGDATQNDVLAAL